MVLIMGIDWEDIGRVHMYDLGLKKCSNCNQDGKAFTVIAMVHVSKILAWQIGSKFGSFKKAWNFMIMCPTCEKGYKFNGEEGRNEVQGLMMKQNSLAQNIWAHFIHSHLNFHYITELKERNRLIKQSRKEAKRTLEDLAKLGMVALVEELVSYKHKKGSVNYLKKRIEENKHLEFDIELK